MKETIVKICNRIIEFSFYLLFFIAPLILTPYNFELFEFNKTLTVYAFTILIIGAWIIKSVAERQFKIQRTPLDIPIILFFIAQVLSTIFSIDTHTSLYGFYSRFHGGLLSTICYLSLFYALVTNLNKKSKIFSLIYVSLFSGVLVASYGILEHNGIDAKYWVQDVQNRVFSTLGQPNWLAAYLDVLLLITIGLIFYLKNKLSIVTCLLLSVIFYVCLLYTKSRSAFIAFLIGLAFFLVSLFIIKIVKKSLKNYLQLSVICLLLIAIVTFFVQPPFFNLDKYGYSTVKSLLTNNKITTVNNQISTPQGPALEVGGTESGVIRKIVWQGALDIAFAYPLFGSGVETFAYSYYKFRPASHNLVSEWDFLYNKAHNEYLNYAATTGFIGLGTYLLVILFFIIFVIIKILKELKTDNLETNHSLEIAFLAAYFTILITNFFGFSVVVIALFFWLIPAFYLILSEKINPDKSLVLKLKQDYEVKDVVENKKKHSHQRIKYVITPPLSNYQISIIIILIIIITYLQISIYRYWLADKNYAIALNNDKVNNFTVAYPLLKEAISLMPNEPVYYDELSYNAANIASLAYSQKQNQIATQLINEALSASQKAIKISPSNVTFYKTRTKMFYVLSTINAKYNYEALNALLQAKDLAPTDAKIVYNLAILYARVNQKDKALETFQQAINLKTDYRDARYALGLYLFEQGDKVAAIKEFQYIIAKVEPKDQQVIDKLKEWTK